jgi:hypothetical protein
VSAVDAYMLSGHIVRPIRSRGSRQQTETLPCSAGVVELAFLRDTLERLGRVLDAILIIGPVRWKKLEDFVGPVRTRTTDWTRGKEHGLPDPELMRIQRLSPGLILLKSPAFCSNSLAMREQAQYITEISRRTGKSGKHCRYVARAGRKPAAGTAVWTIAIDGS